MRAVVIVLSALALTACGSSVAPGSGASSPTTSSSASSSTSPSVQDPTRLVGSWTVSGATGAEPGAVLRIAEDLSLWQSCGYLMGGWRASGTGLFAANLDGGDGGCIGTSRNPTPAWLRSAAGYRVDGDGIALLGTDGAVVARLSPGGRPTPGPNLMPSLADPPVLDPQLRAALTATAGAGPIPTTLKPATRADLLGTWVTVLPRPSSRLTHDVVPGITFRDDGSYSATDGCNGTAGGWSAEAGSIVATSGASTLIGCDNIDVAQFVATASWAALDDGVLVLLKADGTETGRLRRP